MLEEHDSKTIKVYGDKHAKARKYAQPAYERVVHTREITFPCSRCQQQVTQYHFPGPIPKYCSESCLKAARQEITRQQTRERVRRYRNNRKGGYREPRTV
jgi:glycerol-3-phosphate dehydrogenase